jgi:glycosyltransferase involved in cell wall biosynthesis
MNIPQPLRILHCPTQVGGNPYQLAKAEREIGLDSWSISYNFKYLNFKSDEVISKNRLIYEFKRWSLLRRAIKDFDIIHFNFGQSTMPQRYPGLEFNNPLANFLYKIYDFYAGILELRDLPFIKRMGKKIAVTYQGSDARQGNFLRERFRLHNLEIPLPETVSDASDLCKVERIDQFNQYADLIYSLNPDLFYVLPERTRFLPYAAIDLQERLYTEPSIPGRTRPLVIHAPTHRGIKGTEFLLEAVQRLENENVPFDFMLIEGLPHQEALELYKKADLLVDQLLLGWYGGISVELMAMGKPVICFIHPPDLKPIPEQMREELPFINANPTSIYQVLKDVLTIKKKQLPEIGRRSRRFVEKWHNPLTIASDLKRDYESIFH